MKWNTLKCSRRTFGALSVWLLPAIGPGSGRSALHAQFARDVVRSYELQIIAVDMGDVSEAFRAMRAPVLGCGVATGPDRALRAAEAALRDAGRVARHALIVIAGAPREVRLREYKQVYEAIRHRMPPDPALIYAVCDDSTLAPGSLRVSLLAG